MALSEFFLAPIGLLALGSLLVLVVLYLVSQRPQTIRIPTISFLEADPTRRGSRLRLSRFRRALLFLLQALVLVGCAVAIASPYLAVPGPEQQSAVVVLDTSASMATEDGGATRFEQARSAAASVVAPTTSVVVSGSTPTLRLRAGSAQRASTTLSGLTATDAPGDLGGAIALAARSTAPGVRIHVYSDFADAGDWRGALDRARASGHTVVLHQFAGGGEANVGIVDATYGDQSVTATVQNTGTQAARRTVSLGGQSTTVDLQADDVTTVRLDVPAGGGQLALSPGDSFPVDDSVPVAAPSTATVDVLLFTSEPNRYLVTALSLVDAIDLRVETLPAAVSGEFDVVVFDSVEPSDVLAGNLALGRETLRAGGGVVLTAQQGFEAIDYGDLSLVDTDRVTAATGDPTVADDPLTDGLSFPSPGDHLSATLRDGRALVQTSDGSPLVATAGHEGGQLLYYGYLDNGTFPFEYSYPVFWKRAIYHAAGRESLSSLNRRAGERLSFETPTTVQTPRGQTTETTVALDTVGFYDYRNRRIGVGLLSNTESRLSGQSLPGERNGDDGPVVVGDAARTTERLSLVPLAVLLALLGVAGELALLRYRGEL